MAQRYASGMSRNQKRNMQLGDRLELAARDAAGHEEEVSEGPVKRLRAPGAHKIPGARPTCAPYLEGLAAKVEPDV